MSRIFLLILCLIAAVVLVPSLRERARPHMQPVLDPMYEWSAKNRVKEIANLVKRADAMGRNLPAPGDFPGFVENEDTRANASIDPWGSQYYVVTSGSAFRVGSPGRDRVVNTTDDILSAELPLRMEPDSKRRGRR
jgi:hypothetical protein